MVDYDTEWWRGYRSFDPVFLNPPYGCSQEFSDGWFEALDDYLDSTEYWN